ncbi:Sensor histidine kinase RcsC [bioreactor metagenome]|uniref:Sensor histidine kinase RcsC n=1 Tax=bioreactor metagenome TaxID=1076179 RepID=A0A645CC74_9ZZZZ
MFITKSIYQPKVFDVLMTISEKKKVKLNKNRAQYDFSGYKVLLAEDNELNREIAIALLKIAKLSVDYASNGKEAVDMFLKSIEGEYAAVLMDIQMPVMDGYEAAKTIRASEHPDAQRISIYAMTANTFTEDVSAALSSGMNGHISKPINTVALYEAINESINKEK